MKVEKDPKYRWPSGRGGCRERRDRQNSGGEKQAGQTVRNEEGESDDRAAFADRELEVDSHASKASAAREKGWSARGKLTSPRQREAAPDRFFF